MPTTQEPELFYFKDDGKIPNSKYPLLLYHNAFTERDNAGADWLEKTFAAHNWTNAWRNGVYSYHHYHSTAHEVLGIAAGSVRVRLGGEHGKLLELGAGDVVVIPAGVAHKNEGASPDLTVVGAYPGGKNPDMLRPAVQERERASHNIAEVTLPVCDPVYGSSGPLLDRWLPTDRG